MKCSRFYIYIVLACIITSCSKHLSRKEARNQIQQIVGSDFSSDKKCETFRIHERYLKDHEWNGFGKVCLNANKQNYSDYSELLEKLVENKYIEISDDEYYDDCSNLYTHVKVLNTNDLAATDAIKKLKPLRAVFGNIDDEIIARLFKDHHFIYLSNLKN